MKMIRSIVTSLDTWERKLLLEYIEKFPLGDICASGHSDSAVETDVFEAWSWARKLSDDIEEATTDSTTHSSTPVASHCERVLRWITLSDDGYLKPARVSNLLRDNPQLKGWLADGNTSSKTGEISVLPNETDERYWSIIAKTIFSLPLPWRGLEPGELVPDRIGRYVILNTVYEIKATRLLVDNEGDPAIAEDITASLFSSDEEELASSTQDRKSNTGPVTEIGAGLETTINQLRYERIHGKKSGLGSAQVKPLSPPVRDLLDESIFASHSSYDTMMLLESLKRKLRVDVTSPTDSSQGSVSAISSALNAEREALQKKEPNKDEGEADPHSEDSTSTRHFRVYEIWSLIRMAAMTMRRRLRAASGYSFAGPFLGFVFPFGLDDPGRILEFIPLDELVSGSSISPETELAWNPPKQWSLDHHIFTEEEVFKYCVESGFEFPQYKREGSIVFIARELEKSPILHQMEKLESLWNDCAVTVDPKSGQWYLLETRPGLQFRKISADFTIHAARKSFRQVIDRHRINRTCRLGDILDTIPRSTTLRKLDEYEVVEAIEFSEIITHSDVALGGHSGDVFRATWSCPQKIDMPAPKEFTVVLKRIWPPRPGSRSEARLLRELDLTLEVAVRRPSASSVLHGLTKAPHPMLSAEPSIGAQVRDGQHDNIFLVLEFARNSLEQYLLNVLTGDTSDWDIIAYRFQDLAYSMGTIHGQNIVHRDLHLENIMIRDEAFYRSPTAISGDQLVIIDLGESRAVESLSESYNPYGNDEFWAPEVRSGSCMSKESDIYAVGRVMMAIMELRCTAANSRTVPKQLWHIAESCLNVDPNKRPTADKLLSELNRIIWQHFEVMKQGGGTIVFRHGWTLLSNVDVDESTDSESDSSDSIVYQDDGLIRKAARLMTDVDPHIPQSSITNKLSSEIIQEIQLCSEGTEVSNATTGHTDNGRCQDFKNIEDLRLVRYDQNTHSTAIDKCRIWIEEVLGYGEIDWRPLPPVKRSLSPNIAKLAWKYGSRDFVIVLDEDQTKRCTGKVREADLSQSELPLHHRQNSVTGNTGNSHHKSILHSCLGALRSLIPMMSKASVRGQNQTSQTSALKLRQNLSVPCDGETMEFYLCADKPWRAAKKTTLCTIAVHGLADDCDFYTEAMKALRQTKGWWLQRLLSWKSYSTFKLSQFSFLFDDSDLVSTFMTSSFVEDPASVYLGHEYSFYLLAVDVDVHMRMIGQMILTGLYEPHLGRGSNAVLRGIPKRRVPPTLTRKALVSGWSFQAKQGLCMCRILYWVHGVVVLGIAFIPFWMAGISKVDLQNAFVPVTFLATMAMLWLAIAALSHSV